MSAPALKIDYVDKKTRHEFHLPVTIFKKPSTEKEYADLERILDKLIDEVRGDEKHPLTVVMQIIGDNLEQYDNEHHLPIGAKVTDVAMVKYLMQANQLNQADMADIFGGQGNVSKFLHGERPLSKSQIAKLKLRFGLSADFFVK